MISKGTIVVSLLALSLFIISSCNSKYSVKERLLDSLFLEHLNSLDLIVSNDFVYEGNKATRAIEFLERTTGITGSGEGDIIGKYHFTEEDLERWRNWYDTYKGSLIENVRDTAFVNTVLD